MGKLIVMEGACDGIGKTTQFHLLKEHLERDGEIIRTHHFPSYGTYQARGVEEYLKGNYGSFNELSPYFINSLYANDRAITWRELLEEYYNNGDSILLDRYTTSSLIYQSANIKDKIERREFIDYIEDFEYTKLGLKKPDKVIFLTAPFDVVTSLREKRENNEGVEHDIHEADIEFMKRVYDNSNELANYLNWDIIDCSLEGGMDSIESIHSKVYQKVK